MKTSYRRIYRGQQTALFSRPWERIALFGVSEAVRQSGLLALRFDLL